MRRMLTVVIVFVVLVMIPLGQSSAQDATPVTTTGGLLDLAAMALAPDDVPEGFFDDYGELLVPADAISDLVLWGGPSAPGLERTYQSFYFNPEEAAAIHVFLFEFASPDQATSGAMTIVEALRPPLPEGTTVGPTHATGPALGEEPRTTTYVTYDTWAAGGPRVDIIAASFRRDRLVVGVAVESYIDPPESATPVAAVASPSAPDPAQEQLAVSLASTLDARVTDVLAGISPAGADLALSGMVLSIDQLAGEPLPVLGGYKSGIDLLRCGICGEENSLLPFGDVALGGYSRTVTLGQPPEGQPHEPQPPWVSVAVSAFASPEDALAVLEAVRLTPNDRPTPGPVPRGMRTLAADPEIPGATSALAFTATSDEEDPNAPVDSGGVDFVLGNWLVTVDVQGGLEGEAALAAAIDLATQQAACLTAGGPCGSPNLPPSLVGME